MMPASKFKRLIAYIIDNLIASAGFSIVVVILGLILALAYIGLIAMGVDFDLKSFIYSDFFIENIVIISNSLVCLIFLICFILPALYYSYFESSRYQATPGKMLLKLYVSDKDNNKISFKQAFFRYVLLMWPYFLVMVSVFITPHGVDLVIDDTLLTNPDFAFLWLQLASFILYIVFLIPIFFTKQRTTLYDILSGTRVNAEVKGGV